MKLYAVSVWLSACACVWLGAFSSISLSLSISRSLSFYSSRVVFTTTSIRLSASSGARTWDSRLLIVFSLLWVHWTRASKADRAHINVKNGKELKKAQQNERTTDRPNWTKSVGDGDGGREGGSKREKRVSSMDYVCMATLRFRHIGGKRKVAQVKKFRKPPQTGMVQQQPIYLLKEGRHDQRTKAASAF